MVICAPEARLWQATLARALHDAAMDTDTGWIGSPDFQMVCSLAGLDPEAVAGSFDPERYRALMKAA